MPLTRATMLYADSNYYTWKAKEEDDNPNRRGGKDRVELDRTEGYEVLYFLNKYVHIWISDNPPLKMYHKAEEMLRHKVPKDLRRQADIARWMAANW